MPVKADSEDNPALTREQRLALSPRVAIGSDTLHGSIALKGALFDDLTLAKYRETQEPNSPEVTLLLAQRRRDQAYFAQIGWVSPDGKTKVPDQHTLWQADKKTLAPGDTVHLRWDNGAGVTFMLAISLDTHYMFTIDQRVENHSGHAIAGSCHTLYQPQLRDPPKHPLSCMKARSASWTEHSTRSPTNSCSKKATPRMTAPPHGSASPINTGSPRWFPTQRA